MQKLLLPINATRVTAGYKNPAYRSKFNMTHFGADYYCTNGDIRIWGSGDGVVLAAGYDNFYGNTIIIRYNDAIIHRTGKVADVIFRYVHLRDIFVSKGMNITIKTLLGNIGATGRVTGAHLHLEIDTDVDYPEYSPSSGRSDSNIIKKGVDTTINPTDILYKKITSPDFQSVLPTVAGKYVYSKDINYPILNTEEEKQEEQAVTKISDIKAMLKIGFASSGDMNTILNFLEENEIKTARIKTNYIYTMFIVPEKQSLVVDFLYKLIVPVEIFLEYEKSGIDD